MEKITLPKKNPSLTALICCVFIDLAPSLAEMRHAVIPLLVFRLSISSSPLTHLGLQQPQELPGATSSMRFVVWAEGKGHQPAIPASASLLLVMKNLRVTGGFQGAAKE